MMNIQWVAVLRKIFTRAITNKSKIKIEVMPAIQFGILRHGRVMPELICPLTQTQPRVAFMWNLK